MKKIACIGELLIDFICSDIDVDLSKGVNFIKKAGGAPANVAASISKLGGEAFFIGKVGNDSFGEFLKQTLDDVSVNTKGLILDSDHHTTLAFVSLKNDGERDFIFNRGADGELSIDEIELKQFENGIYHFGSATALLPGKTKTTYIKAMELAKEKGGFISFDPNYRDALWNDIEKFKTEVYPCLEGVDFLKVSEEELEILGGSKDKKIALEKLHRMGSRYIAVTLGSRGTLISDGKDEKIIPSIKIKPIDSTGAGDAFVGGVLYKISQRKDYDINFEEICEIIKFSNRVGAITCKTMGAISSLPTLEEVEKLGEER
jgi:fructokinase